MSVAFMVGCSVQTYGNAPFLAATSFQDLFAAMSPESKLLCCAVAVCGKKSLFTHTTLSPGFTVRFSGTNFMFSTTIVCVVDAANASIPTLFCSRHANETHAAATSVLIAACSPYSVFIY